MNNLGTKPSRIAGLDLFRGYAILGMIVVNFLGTFACIPHLLKHTNDYCSYADTIMPHFLFAVGFALQLVWCREQDAKLGSSDNPPLRIVWKITKRCLRLMIVAFVIYVPWAPLLQWSNLTHHSFWFTILKRDWFQTLTHIAVTTIWVLPALRFHWFGKLGWMLLGIAIHMTLSDWFYFRWVHESPSGIDGGPLGFFTWAVPTIVGMLAHESWTSRLFPENRYSIQRVLCRWILYSIVLMLLGYGLSCMTRRFDREKEVVQDTPKLADSPVRGPVLPIDESRTQGLLHDWKFAEPPLIPPPPFTQRAWNYWMMSQRAGTLSYQLFGAGFSLIVFAGFVYLSDQRAWTCMPLTILGQNAIAVYIAHGLTDMFFKSFIARDASIWLVLGGLLLQVALMLMLALFLHSRRWLVRL